MWNFPSSRLRPAMTWCRSWVILELRRSWPQARRTLGTWSSAISSICHSLNKSRLLAILLTLVSIYNCSRVQIEVQEGGTPGMSKSQENKKVGVLKQKYFEVDRAFIYFIWDYFTGSIILIGRVTEPILWSLQAMWNCDPSHSYILLWKPWILFSFIENIQHFNRSGRLFLVCNISTPMRLFCHWIQSRLQHSECRAGCPADFQLNLFYKIPCLLLQ